MTDGALRSSFEDLRNDLQAVARDAEALLKATAEVGGERIEELRARTQATLRRTQDHLRERNLQMRERARDADSYVRDHSWSAIAIAAGVGALVGLLVTRSLGRDDTIDSD